MVIVLAIGKAILILLLVIVCILAAVLLLPVRYEVDADIDRKCADARISWLFRLVRFRFHAGDGMQAVLSILFFNIDFTDPEAKKKRAAKKAKRDAKKAAKARRRREKKRRGGGMPEECGDSGRRSFETENKTELSKFNKQPDNLTNQPDGVFAEETVPGKSSIGEKIAGAADAVKDAAGKAGEVKDKVTGFGKTAKRLIGLIGKYEVFDIALPKLVRFLKRIRPRKLSGHLAFGLEDPATTGKLVGALATVPIFYQTELRVVPDFETEETYVNGQVSAKGHLLLLWIVALAIGLIREKNIRRFVSDIRHGRQP